MSFDPYLHNENAITIVKVVSFSNWSYRKWRTTEKVVYPIETWVLNFIFLFVTKSLLQGHLVSKLASRRENGF